jgi:tetratricopeptide (TPR) repeat protein
MMDENALDLVYINRDAIATNRGFYFQYLSLLKKWVENFIEGNSNILHSEVGNDIRESGGELVFTQLKCYSSSFSLNSREIKNALYVFFLNYLREQNDGICLRFIFETNTGLTKNEKLLQSWIDGYPLLEGELRDKCIRRITYILSEEIKKAKGSKLKNAKKNSARANAINDAYRQLSAELTDEHVRSFTSSILWRFSGQSPEASIGILIAEIQQLLKNKAFGGRPANVVMKVLLSEIYRRSQNVREEERELSSRIMTALLGETDLEFSSKIDERVTKLFNEQLDYIYGQLEGIRTEQLFYAEKLEQLENKVHGQQKAHNLPKELSLFPVCIISDLLDRHKEVEEINTLFSDKNHISIKGPDGLGKSTLAKLYFEKYFDKYDHIIWLDAGLNLSASIRLNDVLCSNLGIEILNLSDAQLLQKVVTCLNQIPGNNLMVLDNCNNDELLLGQLCRMRSWKILASSRMSLKNFSVYRLPVMTFDEAKLLFEKYVLDPVEKEILSEFFSLVDYNTLLIELTAKTIQNSLELDLPSFLSYLRDQLLDDLDLAIDIELDGTIGNVQLFAFLEKAFKVSGLNADEENLLDFLALLPSEVDINDLIDIAGADFKKVNTPFFVNTIQNLSHKGWVEREKNIIRIHRMIQETSIYRQRRESAPFQSSMFFLSWLIRRFEEGFLTTPSTSLRFYKYGLSILDAIKEPYRENLYQTLLRLENEVLNIDNMLIGNQDTSMKWQDLERRASAYLDEKDASLGVIRMNLAMSLFRQAEDTRGIEMCHSAIEVFNKNLPLTLQALITAKTNLSVIYSQNYRFAEAMEMLKEVVAIRQKYKMTNDPSLAAASNALALAHQRAGNLDKATAQFKMAIRMHLELDTKYRNDAYLLSIFNNLSINLYLEKKYDESITNQIKAMKIAENLGIYNTMLFRETLDTLFSLYVKLEKNDEADALRLKYIDKYF